jgi:hypothetical protein
VREFVICHLFRGCRIIPPAPGVRLATGYWLLAIGYWLLAIGYWLFSRYAG